MSWRVNISKEEADKLLAGANPRLEFGGTVMGIVKLRGENVAFGRRYFKGMEPYYFRSMGLLGPKSIDIPDREKYAKHHLEELVERLEKSGLMDRFDAFMADSYVTFEFFRCSLIVDNNLGSIDEGFAKGKILLNEKQYKLLAMDGSGVPGCSFGYIAVDVNRRKLGF